MSLTREHLRVLQDRHGGAISEINLQRISAKYTSGMLPAIRQLPRQALTLHEAEHLAALLVTHSSVDIILSDHEFDLPDSHALQGLKLLAEKILNAKTNSQAEQIDQLLRKIFAAFPETSELPAFVNLSREIQLILHNKEEELTLITLAKEKLSIQDQIEETLLTRALAAFNQWKINRRKYTGIICRIVELADALAVKYPGAKSQSIGFCHQMFHNALTCQNLIPRYFIIVNTIVNYLISLDDRDIALPICHHVANAKLDPWVLVEITDHPVFTKLNLSERRVIFNLLAILLNNKQVFEKKHFRIILDKCSNKPIRMALLQRLNEFYRQPFFPPLADFTQWVNQFTDNHAQNLADGLEASFTLFNNHTEKRQADIKLSHERLLKQFEKLKIDLNNYADTSFLHTRKTRADYLKKLCTWRITTLQAKYSPPDNITQQFAASHQLVLQQTITELYLHYASIDNAAGLLSQALEKRLITLLQIPKDTALNNAMTKRGSFFYKFQQFFRIGHSCFKKVNDKAQDPVHTIIQQYLPLEIKQQINHLQGEVQLLGQQDQAETSLFGASALSQEKMAEISRHIASSYYI